MYLVSPLFWLPNRWIPKLTITNSGKRCPSPSTSLFVCAPPRNGSLEPHTVIASFESGVWWFCCFIINHQSSPVGVQSYPENRTVDTCCGSSLSSLDDGLNLVWCFCHWHDDYIFFNVSNHTHSPRASQHPTWGREAVPYSQPKHSRY